MIVWLPTPLTVLYVFNDQPTALSSYLTFLSQESVALCLATSAIGGIWVSAAADFGSVGVIERLAHGICDRFILLIKP